MPLVPRRPTNAAAMRGIECAAAAPFYKAVGNLACRPDFFPGRVERAWPGAGCALAARLP